MKHQSEHLAQNLIQLRAERGWTLNRAACATGVSKFLLQRFEAGRATPTHCILEKIADGFNVDSKHLMDFGTDEAS